MSDEVKDALRLAVDYDNRPRTKSSDARKLDVGKYQSGISERDYAEIMQRNNLQTRDAYARNVKEPGPHADQLGRIGEYDPINVAERVAASRKYGPSTVVDPEGRKGSPLFVAGTTPTGENVPLNLGQQAGLAEHLSRMFEYKTKGDYAAGRTWGNPQQKLPFGLSGSTLGMNKAYKGNDPEYALPHEIGHVIHNYQGRAINPLAGAPQQAADEFQQMALKRRLFDYGAPDTRGNYTEDPKEKWAEGVKAYLTNPAKFKSEYPEAAKFMRKIINTDPNLNKLLMLSRREGPHYAAHGGEISDALRLAKSVKRNKYALGGTPTDLTVGSTPTTAVPTTTTTGTQPSNVSPYQPYVSSLYQNILGRQADPGGLNYWTGQLSSGAQTTQNVLEDFVKSQEYQDLFRTDPNKAVSGLYQAALGRAPDPGGLNYWVGRTQPSATLPALNAWDLTSQFKLAPEFGNYQGILNSYIDYTGAAPTGQQMASAQQAIASGKTLSDVTGQIAYSPAAVTNFVKNAYQDVLGRPADPGGLNYWVNKLNNGEVNPEGLINSFANTVEGLNNTNTKAVNQTYQNLLGRAPTTAEINNPNSLYNDSLSKMAAGTLSLDQLQSTLAADPEAVNYQNTNLVKDTYQALLGRQPTTAEINNPNSLYNDSLSKMAAGTLDPDQLFQRINELPESQTYQLSNMVPKEYGPRTVAQANQSVPQDSAVLQGFFGPIEKTLGLPPGVLLATMGIESTYGTNQQRPGSQYKGAFQMGRAERADYGVINPFNWQQSALGAARYMADNAKTFIEKTGQQPTLGDFYGMHQQGVNGWTKIVNNPNGLASKSLGYQKVLQNLPNNLRPLATRMTNKQFREFLDGKVQSSLEGPDKKGYETIRSNPYGTTPPASGGGTTTPIGPGSSLINGSSLIPYSYINIDNQLLRVLPDEAYNNLVAFNTQQGEPTTGVTPLSKIQNLQFSVNDKGEYTPQVQPVFDQAAYDAAVSSYQAAYNDWRSKSDLYIAQEMSYGNPNPQLPSWWPAAPGAPNPQGFVSAPQIDLGQQLAGVGAGGNVAGNSGAGAFSGFQPILGYTPVTGTPAGGSPYQPIPDSAINAMLLAGTVSPYIVQGGAGTVNGGVYGGGYGSGGGYSGGYSGGGFSGSSGGGFGVSYMNKGGVARNRSARNSVKNTRTRKAVNTQSALKLTRRLLEE